MDSIGNKRVKIVVQSVLFSGLLMVVQLVAVPIIYFKISNIYFNQSSITIFGSSIYDLPVFLCFGFCFLVFGACKFSTQIQFWIGVGVLVLFRTLTIRCEAPDFVNYLELCVFSEIWLFAFCWVGYFLAKKLRQNLGRIGRRRSST